MGWFNKTVTLTEYDLDGAKLAIGLDLDETLRDSHVWRVRMAESSLPADGKYFVGYIKNKGNAVGVFVGKQEVGKLIDQSLPSAVEILRKHGGMTAPCVVSKVTNGWNVYVNMS